MAAIPCFSGSGPAHFPRRPRAGAFVALIRLLDKLWDDHGNTIVPGLTRFEWPGADYPEPLLREMASVLPGVEILGDASVSSKLWSEPNATVIGIDAPSVDQASNVLIPQASAKVSMRVAPGADDRFVDLSALLNGSGLTVKRR